MVSASGPRVDSALADDPNRDSVEEEDPAARTLRERGPVGLYDLVWYWTSLFYYDPDKLSRWKDWERLLDSEIHTLADAAGCASKLLRQLNDPFTFLRFGKEHAWEKELSGGSFVGCGLVFYLGRNQESLLVKDSQGRPLPVQSGDGFPVVGRVIDGSPAKLAGLKQGDVLTACDRLSLNGMSHQELTSLLSGSEGMEPTITVLRDGRSWRLPLRQARVPLPIVSCRQLHGGIGYVRLESFMQESLHEDVRKALSDLDQAKALVIDLRKTPGGYSRTCTQIMSLLLREGTLWEYRDRIAGAGHRENTVKLTSAEITCESAIGDFGEYRTTKLTERQPDLSAGRPLVILIDNNTRSAPEVLTACLQDNRRAKVVGTRSFGKGIGQGAWALGERARLAVTHSHWWTPNGTWLGDGANTSFNGIRPDLLVEPACDLEFGQESDNQLKAALEILR